MLYKKRRKYKYILQRDEIFETGFELNASAELNIICINKMGVLTIKKGYTWDGPSGLTIDTKNFMRGSLVHDALYQLMRENLLPQKLRAQSDQLLKNICLEDGMSIIRAWIIYVGVRWFGASSAKPDTLSTP